MNKKTFNLLLKSIDEMREIHKNRTFETYKHIRKSWGIVKPVTKIKQSDKLYSRKKEKEKIRREIDGELK